MPRDIAVPGSVANLGPGFDCLGMALDIWNSIAVRVGQSGFEVTGEGEDTLPRTKENVVARCFRIPFEEAKPKTSLDTKPAIENQMGIR